MTKMKKHEFIKYKVVEHIVKASVEKATLILHTNVTHGINDSNETSHAWMVQSQQHSNMTYKVPFPFTKYVCCTCEWALRGNLCKHQGIILFTCIDLTEKNIIQYCGTWYGFDCGNFVAMFMNPTYLHIYDNEFDDEEANEDHFEEAWVVDMCELMTPDDTSPICLSKANVVMHLGMVFHCINNGLGNSVHLMKDWHDMMLEHGNIYKKKVHE
jgi:hypothetical protein